MLLVIVIDNEYFAHVVTNYTYLFESA